MTAATARDHLRHEVLIGGISNTIFNGLIAWLLLKSGPALAWGGEHSFAVDVIATALLLPFIVALIESRCSAASSTRASCSRLTWAMPL